MARSVHLNKYVIYIPLLMKRYSAHDHMFWFCFEKLALFRTNVLPFWRRLQKC